MPRRLFEHEHFAAAPLVADGSILYLAHDGLLHRRSLADLRHTILASRHDLGAQLFAAPQLPESSEPWSWPYPPLPKLVAADDTHVFWVDAALGAVASLAKAGGSPSLIAKDLGAVTGLAVDRRYVYVVARSSKVTALVRYSRGANQAAEALATTPHDELLSGVADKGVYWVMQREDALDNDVDVFGLLKDTGFRRLGELRSPFEQNWYETPLCDFAVNRDALYFSGCSAGNSLVMSRSFDGAERILASGFTAAGLIVADSDDVYFAELGDRHMSKGLPITLDCCSIWVAPRERAPTLAGRAAE